MTAPSTNPSSTNPSSTTASPGSRKTHLAGPRPAKRVPIREVVLRTGASVVHNDASGPYTEPAHVAHLRSGLPALRARWTAERQDTETYVGRPVRPEDDGRRS